MKKAPRIASAGLLLLAGTVGAETLPVGPNFIFIMMDDFGAGQFASEAAGLTTDSFDPAFICYVAGMTDGQYSNDEALKATRRTFRPAFTSDYKKW